MQQVFCKGGIVQAVPEAASSSLPERDNLGNTHFKRVFGDSAVVSLGGLGTGYLSKAADFVCDDTNGTITFNNNAAAATLTLPDASSFNATTGFPILEIKRYDSAASTNTSFFTTVSASGGQTIDGDTSIFLVLHGETVRIQSDGANWKILSRTWPNKTVAKAAAFNAAAEGTVYLVTTGAADKVATLGPAANWKGKRITFKKVDNGAGKVVITPAAGNVDGAASNNSVDTQWDCAEVMTDGTDWYIVSVK